MVNIRLYSPDDCAEIIRLFYNTVHFVNIRDYDQEQIEAWAPSSINEESWCGALSTSYALVYVESDIILGFGNMTDNGVLDRLYIDHNHQGEGIGSQLLYKLEKYALSKGINILSVHASKTARSFFEKHGYILIKEQEVERNNIRLTNYLMKKNINKQAGA